MALASQSVSPVPVLTPSLRVEKNSTTEAVKPNLEEFQAKIAVERDKIDELFKRVNALTARVTSAQSDYQTMARQREEIRIQVDAYTSRIEELEKERDKLFSQIDETQRSERDMKIKVQALKKSLGVQSEEEINSKIRNIERQIMSTRLTVPEENKLIHQIKQLRNSRPLVEQCAEMETTAATRSQASVVPLRMRFDEVREELRQCMQKRRGLFDARRRLAEHHRAEMLPVRDLVEQRDQLRVQLAEHRHKETILREQMAIAMQDYQSLIAKLQREKQEFDIEERRRKQLDFERQTLQQRLDSADDEVERITTSPEHRALIRLQNYVKALADAHASATGAGDGDTEPGAEKQQIPPVAAPPSRQPLQPQEGVLMLPKSERSDANQSITGRKKNSRKGRSANKALASQQQPLTHDLVTLSDFTRLSIEPPHVPADCAPCLCIIEEKLQVIQTRHEKSKQIVEKRRQAVLAKLQALDIKDGSRMLQSGVTTPGSGPDLTNDIRGTDGEVNERDANVVEKEEDK